MNEEYKNTLSEAIISKDIFELGMTGCVEPADLDTQELYTWRRKLPAEQQTDDQFAEDISVRVIKSSPHGTYFSVAVECLANVDYEIVAGRPIDCAVSPDGIVLNNNENVADIEQGYFLSGDPLPGYETKESIVFAKVPVAVGRISLESTTEHDLR